MDWRFYIKRSGTDQFFRAIKVLQQANEDITLIPHKSLHLPQSLFVNALVGEKYHVQASTTSATVHHFSAHSRSGQRHVKYSASDKASDPIIGESFKGKKVLIPLATLIVTTNRQPDQLPKNSNKSKWYGFELPPNVDYCKFDFFAVPKGMPVNFSFNHSINNTKQSKEYFNQIIIPQRTVDLVLIFHATDHNSCSIPYNVFVPQAEGKTAQVVRVDKDSLQIEVSNLSINPLTEGV